MNPLSERVTRGSENMRGFSSSKSLIANQVDSNCKVFESMTAISKVQSGGPGVVARLPLDIVCLFGFVCCFLAFLFLFNEFETFRVFSSFFEIF